MRTSKTLLLCLPLLALSLASCSAADPASQPVSATDMSDSTDSTDTTDDPSTASSSTPAQIGDGHGTLEGSTEVAEPQLHLMTLDPDGRIDLLDLADETTTTVDEVVQVSETSTDGRYLFASSATTGAMTIIDSGMWTWDHEDHFHYYSGEPKTLGTIDGEGEATVTSGTSATGVYFPDSGKATVLDNDALAKGEISVRAEISTEPHPGVLAPLSDVTLLSEPDSTGTAASVQAYDKEGQPIDGATADCTGAQGTITTSVGTVIGCDDGALLVTLDDREVVYERIPYPANMSAPKATEFRAREGRPTVAAVAGDQGAWLLDTRERSWQFLPTEVPLLQVSAVDDREGHVVALAADGRVLVLIAETGETIAATESLLPQTLTDPALLSGVELTADQQRAYLNAPAEQILFEIDFADDARIARTFDTDTVPAHLAEVGR